MELNPDRASRCDSSINIECALNLGVGSAVPPAGSADPPFVSARYYSEYLPPYQPRYGKCTQRDIAQRANSSRESFCSAGTEPRSAGDTLQSSQNCRLGVRSDLDLEREVLSPKRGAKCGALQQRNGEKGECRDSGTRCVPVS